jgi:hypothetical protein
MSMRSFAQTAIGLGFFLIAGCSTTQPTVVHSSARPAVRPEPQMRTISEAEFEDLKKTLLFSADDVRYLQMSRPVLEPNVDALLDVWYGFVGSNPHLLYYFSNPTTKAPDMEYLSKVKVRFRQWVLATADANFNQDWLTLQLELGMRHHRLKKNKTDGVDAVDHVPFRHLVGLYYPITTTLAPFLAKGGHSQKDIDGMLEAWRKAVLLTTILWSQPYVEASAF